MAQEKRTKSKGGKIYTCNWKRSVFLRKAAQKRRRHARKTEKVLALVKSLKLNSFKGVNNFYFGSEKKNLNDDKKEKKFCENQEEVWERIRERARCVQLNHRPAKTMFSILAADGNADHP